MKYTKQYLNILRRVNESNRQIGVGPENCTLSENIALIELIESGFLKGSVSGEIGGNEIKNISGIQGTLRGRMFQDDLHKQIHESSLSGKTRKYSIVVLAFLIGLAPTFLQIVFQSSPTATVVCEFSDPDSKGSQNTEKTNPEKNLTDED